MSEVTPKRTLRIAALADLHYSQMPQAAAMPQFDALARDADVLLLCGDLTHHGLAEEAAALAKELGRLSLPMLAVLGNHDHHSDQQAEIKTVLAGSKVHLLDGDSIEVGGVGFAGVKGFMTGFGSRILEPWGEASIKGVVREAVDEALRLEAALARLRTPQRVALLHYSPILETVLGEPESIHAFLGSSRLEDPLNRFHVTAAFHGHAHHGAPEGRTSAGVPVYNVSLPLLRRLQPDGPPYRIVEIEVEGGEQRA